MARILITGAARGIGLQLARQLSERGEQVIAAVRNTSPDLDALEVEVIEGIDVTRGEDRQRLRQALTTKPIDVLINNAGVLTAESLDDLDIERIRLQFEINAIAPLALSHDLLPVLAAQARIVMITSRMGSIDDNTSGGMYGYRMSKAAVNMAGKSLAHDLKPKGIAVGLFHPGLVATRMTHFQGIEPAGAAAQLIQRLDQLNLNNSGEFYHANGESLPW